MEQINKYDTNASASGLSYLGFLGTLLMAILWSGHPAKAQLLGNEWINYNQQYWKLKTVQDGLYQITFNDLQQAGFPVTTVDPRRIQLFHKGVEQAIDVIGQADGRFDATDVIYFFGKRNDGEQDAELYRPREAQPHQLFSLYSDTASYFLTYRLDGGNGKRMVRETAGGTITNLPLITVARGERQRIERGTYYNGMTYSVGSLGGIHMSWWDYGNGFFGSNLNRGQQRDHAITSIIDRNTAGGTPLLEVMLVGRNIGPHRAEILVGATTGSLRSIGFMEYNDHNAFKQTFTLQWSDIGENGSMIVRVASRGVTGFNTDLNCPAYFTLHYPKLFNNSTEELIIHPGQAVTNGRLQVTDGNQIFDVFDITDRNNVRILRKALSGTTMNVAITAATTPKRLFKVPTNGIRAVGRMERVTFTPINIQNFDYFIISHRNLMRPAGGYANPVEAYRAYRASAQGGNYRVLVMDIHDLYDQFSYGEPHAMAVYRIVRRIYNEAANPVLFLIGKPVSPRFRPWQVGNTTVNNTDFVPTAGEPLSDNLFSIGLGPDERVPVVPTGRLNARTPEHVAAYLDKVKEHDARGFDDPNRKHILHLSGGANNIELSAFRSFLNQFATISEGPLMGARTTTLGKRTTAAVEFINVSQEVNEGVSLITFFGHSGADVADIDIGNATDDQFGYRNKGKYPLMLVNGCDAGNYGTTSRTFGEDWITARDRGAIAFMAHSHVGITTQLRRYSEFMYRIGLTDSAYFERGIGMIAYEAFRELISLRNSNVADLAHAQQTNYQGDPVVKLFPASKPDYTIDQPNLHILAFDGGSVRFEQDSFQLGIPIRNLARAELQTLDIAISRQLPDGRIVQYPTASRPNIFYADTFYVTIPKEPEEIPGISQVQIRLDPENKIPEIREDNNQAIFTYELKRSGTANVFPGNFSIVNTATVTLVAQSNDLLNGEREFEMEVDTTRFFNSPATRKFISRETGVTRRELNLAQVRPNLPDTAVFFWRTRFADPRPDEDTTWTLSSFTYIKDGPKGWIQAHPQQFEDNLVAGLEPNYPANRWDFLEFSNNLMVRTYGASHPDLSNLLPDVIVNEVQLIISASYGACRNNTLNAIAFDQFSANPYRVLSYNQFEVLDPASCGRIPSVINNMIQNDINGNRRIIEAYVNNVKAGDWVVMFSIGTVQYSTWRDQTYDSFAQIGLDPTQIRNLPHGQPVIIFGKKGAPVGEAIIIRGTSANPAQDEIQLEREIEARLGRGRFKSPLIGAAQTWRTFRRNLQSNAANEAGRFNIYGVRRDFSEQLLISNAQGSSLGIAGINTSQYPYMRLEAILENEQTFRPAQVRQWMLIYDELPDGALYFSGQAQGNSVVQGTPFEYPMEFFNISGGSFTDSLVVEYRITNRELKLSTLKTISIPAPAPGQSSKFRISVNTIASVGIHDIEVVVNNRIQVESNYLNNKLVIPGFLNVTPDRVNPIVDVAFDGQYIMDGDIVSSRPLITVEMRDDNVFIKKADTLGIQLELRRPCPGCQFQTIAFSDPRVQWYPATDTRPFRIEYRPEFNDDGLHTLRVQAADAAGNLAGAVPFSINFEVVNASEVTNFYPYPNPFSTSTRFVFTLTGSEVPDDVRIQIMTVAGRVVREIGMDEIGPIRIGNNLTEFAWDGTDQFGDRLANGVYFYRVVVKMAGGEMARRATSGDRAFQNGYGKLYILR
jgi:hypothetical protein